MRWIGRQRSGNVQDRRGMGGGIAVGGGIGGIIIVVLALLMGKNPLEYINTGNPTAYQEQSSAADDEKLEFVSVVLKDTEDVWNKLFQVQISQAAAWRMRRPARFIARWIRKYISTLVSMINFKTGLGLLEILPWRMW
jgi:predicted metalloprotease